MSRPRAYIKVDASESITMLNAQSKRARDMRPVFLWVRGQLEKANERNFASNGAFSGRPWAPLDAEYRQWKFTHGQPNMMVQSWRLRNSLTNLSGPPNDIGRDSARFGTNVPYAKFHQAGTTNMPARTIVFTPLTFGIRLAEKIGVYVTEGTEAPDYRNAKELF